MFQREVAERAVATSKERADYGRLAALCGWRAQARVPFDIQASAFTPPPKVTSSLVELVPDPLPLPCDARLFSLVTQAAFDQPRKILRQSLKTVGVETLALLEAARIEPTRHAEEVEIEGFAALA